LGEALIIENSISAFGPGGETGKKLHAGTSQSMEHAKGKARGGEELLKSNRNDWNYKERLSLAAFLGRRGEALGKE